MSGCQHGILCVDGLQGSEEPRTARAQQHSQLLSLLQGKTRGFSSRGPVCNLMVDSSFLFKNSGSILSYSQF